MVSAVSGRQVSEESSEASGAASLVSEKFCFLRGTEIFQLLNYGESE